MSKSFKITDISFYPWLAWGMGALFFFVIYFPRLAPSVMTGALIQEFGVSAVALGGLASMFYYPYIIMQVPVGLMVDRYPVRHLLSLMILATAVASMMFALSQNLWQLYMARIFIGFTAAFGFVSAIKVATIWFPPERVGLLAGLTQAVGMIGGAVSDSSLSFAVDSVGWRASMMGVSAGFLLVTVLFYSFVRSPPKEKQSQPETDLAAQEKVSAFAAFGSQLKQVLVNPQSWWNAFYVGLLYAPTAALAEMWGVTYLQNARGFSHAMAATINGLTFIGWGVGGPLMGWLSDRFRLRKPFLLISSVGSFVLLGFIFYSPPLPAALMMVIFFTYGLFNTGVGVSYAVATEINPRHIAGTSLAFANMASILIGPLLQPLIGKILDLSGDVTYVNGIPHYSRQDFFFITLILMGVMGLATVMGFFVRETHCKPV